jgi:hypothetical protein
MRLSIGLREEFSKEIESGTLDTRFPRIITEMECAFAGAIRMSVYAI